MERNTSFADATNEQKGSTSFADFIDKQMAERTPGQGEDAELNDAIANAVKIAGSKGINFVAAYDSVGESDKPGVISSGYITSRASDRLKHAASAINNNIAEVVALDAVFDKLWNHSSLTWQPPALVALLLLTSTEQLWTPRLSSKQTPRTKPLPTHGFAPTPNSTVTTTQCADAL
jgi:hypothetical protein